MLIHFQKLILQLALLCLWASCDGQLSDKLRAGDASPGTADKNADGARDLGLRPSDLAAAESGAAREIGVSDGTPPDTSQAPADTAITSGPLVLSLVMRQKIQSCSSCGIWFHWQGVQDQKPRLEVRYEDVGNEELQQVQHGPNGEDNAHSITLTPGGTEADRDERRHAMLIKKTPARTGLFRAELSDIPATATITSARLHLHLHDQEGLAFSDQTSVFTIHECPGDWSWDTVTWTHRSPGIPWSTPGGDADRLALEVHVGTDMHQRGFNKAAPSGFFDITEHLQQLQAER